MTDDTPRFPNWLPPEGKISWIHQHADPVLEEAERMLHERYPGAEIHRPAMTVGHLAKWGGPTPTMKGLCVGTVWTSVSGSGGTFAMVDILITCDGQLIVRPGLHMHD